MRTLLLSLFLSGTLLANSSGAFAVEHPSTQPPQPPQPTQVPVIIYHHLAPEPEVGNPSVVTTAEFQQQMAWLQAAGFQPITTGELGAWLEQQAPLPPRPVLVSFDDGYQSNYELAYPILKEMHWKATLFLVTSKVGRTPGKYPYVTWEQLTEMTQSQVFEVQAHAHNGHQEIDGTPAYILWSEEEIRQDLQAIQQELTSHNLPAATALAYPYGAYDAETIQAATTVGLKWAFTGGYNFVRQGDAPLTLKRLSVTPGYDQCHFLALVTGEPAQCQ